MATLTDIEGISTRGLPFYKINMGGVLTPQDLMTLLSALPMDLHITMGFSQKINPNGEEGQDHRTLSIKQYREFFMNNLLNPIPSTEYIRISDAEKVLWLYYLPGEGYKAGPIEGL